METTTVTSIQSAFPDDTSPSDTTEDEFSTDVMYTMNQSDTGLDCKTMIFDLLEFTPSRAGIDRIAATFPTNADIEANDVSVLGIFLLLVCVVGLLGNITVIILILSQKELKKGVTVWYILQLAIADMLFISTIPFEFLEEKYSRWTLSESSCKFKQSIMFINFYSSISFLTVMALDRYVAVCQSLTDVAQKLRSQKAAYIITAVVWIGCISASTPTITNSIVDLPGPKCKLFSRATEIKTKEETCRKDGNFLPLDCCMQLLEILEQKDMKLLGWFEMSGTEENATFPENPEKVIQNDCSYFDYPHGFKVLIITNFVVFMATCIVIVSCYALIMRHLWTKAFLVKGASTNNTKNRNRVIYMCIALVLVFVAFWIPYHAQHLAKLKGIAGRSTAYCQDLTYATSLLLYVNSAINPFIYFFIARLKSHIKSLKSSRAASVMITLFSRNGDGDRTPITKRSTRIETKKNDVKYSEGRLSTAVQSNA